MLIRFPAFRTIFYWAFIVYVGAMLAFSDTMGLLPFKVAGYNFYGADLILLFFILGLFFYGVTAPFRTKIALALLIMLLFGFLCLYRGVSIGYPFKDVIGDFRRLFLYSLAFGVTWVMLDSPHKLTRLNQLAYLAMIPVVLLTIQRAVLGVSWSAIHEAEDIRALSYISAPVLFWVFFNASSQLLIRAKGSPWLKHLIWAIAAGFTLLISNYRALWLLPVLGLGVIILIAHWQGVMRLGRIILALLIIIIVFFLVVLVLRSVFPDIYGLIEQKFVESVLGFRWEGSFRYFSWGEAWNQFTTNPLFGVGIGHRLQYYLVNSLGQFYLRESTAHNILVDYFYQTGLLGGILFLAPHILFLGWLWRSLKRIPDTSFRPAVALFTTYFSLFALGMLQPFLTIPSVSVLFYLVMAVVSRWVFWGKLAFKGGIA